MPVPVHDEEPARPVDGLLPGERDLLGGNQVHLVLVHQNQRVGDMGSGDVRSAAALHAEHRIAGGHAWEPLGVEALGPDVRQEGCGDERGVDDRLGQSGPAALLEEQHHVQLDAPEAAVRLGEHHPHDTHLREGVPPLRRPPLLALPSGADGVRRALGIEEASDCLLEEPLVLGELEPHLLPPLGSPSTLSATMLRWISLVPA